MSYRVWPYCNRNKGFWQQPSPRRRDVFSFMKSGPVAFHYDCACVLGTGGSQAAFITRKATCWDLRQNGCIETIRIHTDWQCLFKKRLQILTVLWSLAIPVRGKPHSSFTGSLGTAGRPLLNGVHHLEGKPLFPRGSPRQPITKHLEPQPCLLPS